LSDVKWIKIKTDVFDDEKILMIEGLPAADSIIVVWFKLLVLAGKQNNDGVFMMSNMIAYTDEMLASIFRRDVTMVKLALNTFQQLGMVEIIDGVITIPNWNKHQTLDSYDKKKERDRKYQAERRMKQKQLIEKSTDNRLTSNDCNTTLSSDVAISEIEIEIEKDNYIVSKDTICSTDVQRVIDAWNNIGLNHIVKIVEGTQRYKWLKKRIVDYGLEEVLAAIGNVKNSKFLNGENKTGWQATFDWLIRPNNFPKVLDGNYSDRVSGEDSTTITGLEGWGDE